MKTATAFGLVIAISLACGGEGAGDDSEDVGLEPDFACSTDLVVGPTFTIVPSTPPRSLQAFDAVASGGRLWLSYSVLVGFDREAYFKEVDCDGSVDVARPLRISEASQGHPQLAADEFDIAAMWNLSSNGESAVMATMSKANVVMSEPTFLKTMRNGIPTGTGMRGGDLLALGRGRFVISGDQSYDEGPSRPFVQVVSRFGEPIGNGLDLAGIPALYRDRDGTVLAADGPTLIRLNPDDLTEPLETISLAPVDEAYLANWAVGAGDQSPVLAYAVSAGDGREAIVQLRDVTSGSEIQLSPLLKSIRSMAAARSAEHGAVVYAHETQDGRWELVFQPFFVGDDGLRLGDSTTIVSGADRKSLGASMVAYVGSGIYFVGWAQGPSPTTVQDRVLGRLVSVN